jgi:PAS domain S-box-containing protein
MVNFRVKKGGMPTGTDSGRGVREQFLRAILDSVAAFVGVLTPEGILIEVNRVPLEAAHVSAHEVIGKPFEETYWWSYSDRSRRTLRSAIERARRGENSRYDVEIRISANEFLTIDFSLAPVRDDSGRVAYLAASAVDITDRKRASSQRVEALSQAEQARKEADSERQRLQAMIEHVPAAVLFAEAPEGQIVLGNQHVEEILRHPIPHSRNVAEYSEWIAFHPDGTRVHAEEWPLARALRGEVVSGEEYLYQKGDGTQGWIRMSGAPVLASDGTITGSVVAFYDIDREKRSEQRRRKIERAVAESEHQFRMIADAMPQLVWTTRPDGFHDYFNRRWYDYTGATPDRVLGELWAHFLHPDDRERTLQQWYQSLRSGDPFQVEYRFRSSDGTYRWFLARAVPVRNREGLIVRWFGTCTDIHDQKEGEAALRRSNEDLEQFAYAASHDLQEPLRMVAIYSQLLQRRYGARLDQNADFYIEQIVTGAQRMEVLLNDLRSYMHVTNIPANVPTAATADSFQVLSQVMSSLQPAIDESEARIVTGKLPRVGVEPVHLQQILQNIISNAIKYRSKHPPVIDVAAQRTGTEWLFSVTDNGIGIDPQYARQIFGVFKRLHGQKYPGTGIGLAICHKIVERYGGSIWVKSELGRGSTFFFTLPAAEENAI